MNTKTATRVPSPDIAQEAEPQLPAVADLPRQNGPPPTVVMPQTSIAKIAAAISAVMSEIGIIDKDGFNKFHTYHYAKMEDILQKLTPLMARHGIVVFQTEVDRTMLDNDTAIAVRYAFTICHKDGEVWPDRPVQTGLSRCRDSKGGFDDKSFNKAHTAARKYFLLALFQIPTDDNDDADKGGNDGPRQTKSRVPSPNDAPETTYAEPHAFAAKSAAEWTGKFLSFIAAAKTAAEVIAWDEINRDNLTQLAKADPSRLKTVMNAMKARKAEFEAGEPVSADGELPAKAKANEMPWPGTDPEGARKWVVAKLATFGDGDYDRAEAWWTETVANHEPDWFPPDFQDLQGIWRKVEQRLAP